jgi:hypothetical protein
VKTHLLRNILMVAVGSAVFLAIPALLLIAKVLTRPDTVIVQAGNVIYWGAVLIGAGVFMLRIFRKTQNKPLTGIYTLQGIASILVGSSGLMALAAFAPAFPEETLPIYLCGAAIIVLFMLLPMLLFHYANRKFPD